MTTHVLYIKTIIEKWQFILVLLNSETLKLIYAAIKIYFGSIHYVKGSFYICTHIGKLLLCLLLHPPDIIHRQIHPLINRTEELAVEVSEDPLFLLWETNMFLVRAG